MQDNQVLATLTICVIVFGIAVVAMNVYAGHTERMSHIEAGHTQVQNIGTCGYHWE
jgi:hypothetical protein